MVLELRARGSKITAIGTSNDAECFLAVFIGSHPIIYATEAANSGADGRTR
jgi:hypothetical protein